MARSIAQIQASIMAAKAGDATLSGLTSSSNVAMWKLWTYVVAVCQWTMESLFDAFKADVVATIAQMKPHRLQWYVGKAKAFQYGVALPADSDVYAVVPPVDIAVLVVANAAAVELPNGTVRLKAAKLSGGVLAALSGAQLTSFVTYMGRVKDAGVRLQCTSGEADNLQLSVRVYYDALILKADGSRIDGTAAAPVKAAIVAFLDNLPFNGIFSLNSLIAAGQAVDGVTIFEVMVCQANYASTTYVDIKAATPNVYNPDAGYMTMDVGYFDSHVVYVGY